MDSALIYLDQANDYNKSDAALISNLTSVSDFAGKYQQAADYANEALKSGNTSPKVYGILMDSYTKLGRHAEAERYRKSLAPE